MILSMYFNQNLYLCALSLVLIYDLILAFKFLWMEHTFLYFTNYIQVYSMSWFLFFQAKMVNDCVNHVHACDTQYRLQEYILCHYLHNNFFIDFSSKLHLSFLHWKPSPDNFCSLAHPYRLLVSQYIRYNDYLFWSKIPIMYLLFAFAYQ